MAVWWGSAATGRGERCLGAFESLQSMKQVLMNVQAGRQSATVNEVVVVGGGQ